MKISDAYLEGLTAEQAATLHAVNDPGLRALSRHFEAGEAVAFLGAGASAPLYPLWGEVIGELIEAAQERGLPEAEARTCKELASSRPDSVVEALRGQLGDKQYWSALREVLQVRRDPESGRTWTPTHELVCRCSFKAVVTTNYDPGIVDARTRVRPTAVGTGFTSWDDELALDRWRSGEVYGDEELPVLYAHGRHNQPDNIILATNEYHRAYGGRLASVIARMVESAHLVWIGFSFSDARISAVLKEVAERSGIRAAPGGEIRHVAIMGWDPRDGQAPQMLRRLAGIDWGSELVLYPAWGTNHSALHRILGGLADERYPAVSSLTTPVVRKSAPAIPTHWEHGADEARSFAGRVEELARLDCWAADPTVRLVGVTAWGGAGKTALVTHWLRRTGGAERRSWIRGVFAWSFYADPSAERWAQALLAWASRNLPWKIPEWLTPAEALVALTRRVPIVLVLDGLEVMQEGPDSDAYGRLLNGALREVLTAACRVEHGSLVMLTSRFPFADLTGFDGTCARMLEVPPFTLSEGAAVLEAAGPGALLEQDRRELVGEVDGHALAVAAMAALLADHPGVVGDLRVHLRSSSRTRNKLSRVLRFYSERLSESHRYLAAAVSLFARPVRYEQLIAVAGHDALGGRLAEWSPQEVRAAVCGPLAGLLSWHSDGTVSAHPLIRATFGPLAFGAAEVAADVTLTGTPVGSVATRSAAQLVVETMELLLNAGQWVAAHQLYEVRTENGRAWLHLPAARLGQRATGAFVGDFDRRAACADRLGRRLLGFYLDEAGLHASCAGDLGSAQDYLDRAVSHYREAEDKNGLCLALQNLAWCLCKQGYALPAARAAAEALSLAEQLRNNHKKCHSHAFLAWAAELSGDTALADRNFFDADRLERLDSPFDAHLYGQRGTRWGALLIRTGRTEPARRLTEHNQRICQRYGWNEDVARCQILLGRLDLAEGAPVNARMNIKSAIRSFRDGDVLVELGDALTIAAELARQVGDLVAADEHATEALAIAAPRGLVLTQASALAIRARIYADRQSCTHDGRQLLRGRDAADAALRLTTRMHPLPWQELEALQAHADLDRADGIDLGWARRAAILYRRLVPPGLDPDPLATVEDEIV